MAGSSFQVDPASLSTAAPTFRTAGTDVTTALNTLRAALGSDRSDMGHDEPGDSFAAKYEPNKAKILAAIAALAKGLESIDPALLAMAKNYGGADSANSKMFGGH